ncbi:MAG TPA: polysaccharide biosynthesis/export family protein [Blastocatellia bacterium]|nr:polysaccharide biosynthesis/export family protein [Blastocatellia bacterium]
MKTKRITCVLIQAIVLLLAGSLPALAQQERQTRADRAGHDDALGTVLSTDEDYRIGPRDVVEIQIDRAPQLSGTFQVRADGTLLMPYLNRIQAAKKTTDELSAFIAEGLRGRYLKNPIVTVMVRQVNSRSFFVQGAVRRPGLYQIEGRATLLKLISIAGGLAENHGSTAYIIRESSLSKTAQPDTNSTDPDEGPEPELNTVNITGLLKGRFDQNAIIEPGDIVNIPVADTFFVAGEVNAPGSFPLKEGTTVRQAILIAQGTTFKAVTSRAVIFRGDPATGRQQEIKVDVGAIMSGKNPDVTIMANDIVVIPSSRMKSVTGALLSALGLNYSRILLRRY